MLTKRKLTMCVNRLHQRVGVACIDTLLVSRSGALLYTSSSISIDELIVPRARGTRQVCIFCMKQWHSLIPSLGLPIYIYFCSRSCEKKLCMGKRLAVECMHRHMRANMIL